MSATGWHWFGTPEGAARGVEAGWFGGEDYATVGHRMDALRTTLGALR